MFALAVLLSVLLVGATGVTLENDPVPRVCPTDPSIKLCTFRVTTTAYVPVISAFAHLTITGGELADHQPEPSQTVTDCGSFIHLDAKELQFRGSWEKDSIECAWVHPLNEASRLEAEFPLLQLALRGDQPTAKGELLVTTSAHSDGIYGGQVCCGYDCPKTEL